MDRFIAKLNIEHFRERLKVERDAKMRAALQRLLVEEENKLGQGLEQLRFVEQEIAAWESFVSRQRHTVEVLERNGSDSGPARALLDLTTDTLGLHQQYRAKLLAVLEKSSL